jgi:hypothetical protein
MHSASVWTRTGQETHVRHATEQTSEYGWPATHIYIVYDRIIVGFPAKYTVIYTEYIWFWPRLKVKEAA